MKQIHIGDDERNAAEDDYLPPKSVSDLKNRISTMSIYADVEIMNERRALVRVRDDAGTSQFLATGFMEKAWLNKYATRTEPKAAVTLYHFKFK